jgi:hypothetical protein
MQCAGTIHKFEGEVCSNVRNVFHNQKLRGLGGNCLELWFL